jgi:hypothetical protein
VPAQVSLDLSRRCGPVDLHYSPLFRVDTKRDFAGRGIDPLASSDVGASRIEPTLCVCLDAESLCVFPFVRTTVGRLPLSIPFLDVSHYFSPFSK